MIKFDDVYEEEYALATGSLIIVPNFVYSNMGDGEKGLLVELLTPKTNHACPLGDVKSHWDVLVIKS